ncbi:MAG: fatty acid desaturase family protein [Leptospira sp.]|nr:fatty acid desaturase family protein [Leptospira sp.]
MQIFYDTYSFYLIGSAFFLMILGYLGADFFSGLAHFLGDTFGAEDTPVVGQSFIKPFRHHHVDPVDITRHDFIETNGNNCIVSVPVLMAVYHFAPILSELWALFLATFFQFLLLAVFVTNQIHKWSHMENPGAFISWLQKWNLILSKEHHQIHHNPPHDKYYCITCGWLNPILYKVHFFESVKWLVVKFSDIFHLKIRVVG